MKDPEKSHADSAARSHESYKNDLEKSRDDSAARSCESCSTALMQKCWLLLVIADHGATHFGYLHDN